MKYYQNLVTRARTHRVYLAHLESPHGCFRILLRHLGNGNDCLQGDDDIKGVYKMQNKNTTETVFRYDT